MSEVIVITSGKGGVGKTTTVANLGTALSFQNKKTVVVDADIGLRNLDVVMGLENRIVYDIVDVVEGTCKLKQALIKDKRFENLYLLPAAQTRDKNALTEEQMAELCERLRESFDYIIIDCPPALGIITTNALTASDSVIIPVQCEYFALEGITQLLKAVKFTQMNLNSNLKIEGVLLTMFDARLNLGLEVVEEIRKYFQDKVYNTIIPRLVRLTEAPSHGKPIIAYDPKSRGSEAYLNLAKEVIEKNERGE